MRTNPSKKKVCQFEKRKFLWLAAFSWYRKESLCLDEKTGFEFRF